MNPYLNAARDALKRRDLRSLYALLPFVGTGTPVVPTDAVPSATERDNAVEGGVSRERPRSAPLHLLSPLDTHAKTSNGMTLAELLGDEAS